MAWYNIIKVVINIADLIMIGCALLFNGLDIVVGLVGALKNRALVSSKLRDGMFKKLGFICAYALAFIIDNYGALVGLELGVKLLPIMCGYTVITEITSIIENISKINPSILPDKLKKLFDFSNKESDNNGDS